MKNRNSAPRASNSAQMQPPPTSTRQQQHHLACSMDTSRHLSTRSHHRRMIALSMLILISMAAALPAAATATGATTTTPADPNRMVVPLDNYFVYDGSSSDLAQHFYRRFLANDYIAPLEIDGEIPDKVVSTVASYGLSFTNLPGLLQRAVLWDAGYVLDLDGKPIKIYARCGRSMAQISVPLKGYVRGGCIPRNCSTLNGDLFYRSFFCDGNQMGAASLCASENTELLGHSAMWADGAELDDLPDPRVYRHHWASDGEQFLVFSIHTKSQGEEVAWEECPATPAPIFPCVAYAKMTDTSKWCDPVPGKIVAPWLHNYALDHKSATWDYVVAGAIVVALVAVVLSRYFMVLKRQRHRNNNRQFDASRLSLTSSYEDTESESYEPHDYLDTVADNEYTSWLYKSGVPETFHDSTEISSGREDAALKTLQLFEVHPLINFKRIPWTNIQLLHHLATGATGEVWLATLANTNSNGTNTNNSGTNTNTNSNGTNSNGTNTNANFQTSSQQVAVKKLLPEKKGNLTEMQLFASEVFALAKMKHANIVSFIGVAWSTLQNMLLVMEYMDKGDLQNYLAAQKATATVASGRGRKSSRGGATNKPTRFTWTRDKLHMARSVACGLQYLHSLSPKLIHRDIKSKNILLSSSAFCAEAENVLHVKIADFGVSRRKYNFEEEETNLTMTGAVGTVSWTAPELLLGDDYTESIDVYSYGILMTEIDTCELPYHDAKSSEMGLVVHPLRLMKLVIQENRRPELSDFCPEEIRVLILDCLEKDPEKRPSAAQIVERLDLFEATHHHFDC